MEKTTTPNKEEEVNYFTFKGTYAGYYLNVKGDIWGARVNEMKGCCGIHVLYDFAYGNDKTFFKKILTNIVEILKSHVRLLLATHNDTEQGKYVISILKSLGFEEITQVMSNHNTFFEENGMIHLLMLRGTKPDPEMIEEAKVEEDLF